MTTANTGKYGRVNPGPGYGKQYDYTANAVLTADQDGALVTNLGAVAAIALTLPAATAGREFAVMRIAPYSVTVTAAGGDTIQEGGAGGSYFINSRIITVFACMVNGSWEVVLGNNRARSVDVRDFNAVGDGVTNNATAFQSAIDAAGAGGTVSIPVGDFVISAKLDLLAGTRIIGSGRGRAGTVLIPSGSVGTLFELDLQALAEYCESNELSSFRVQSATSATLSRVFSIIPDSTYVATELRLSDLFIDTTDTPCSDSAIYLENVIGGVLDNISFRGNCVDAHIELGSADVTHSSGNNAVECRKIYSGGNNTTTPYGIKLLGTSAAPHVGIQITNCTLQNHTTAGIDLKFAEGIDISSYYSELNVRAIIAGDWASLKWVNGLNVIGGRIWSSNAAHKGILIDYANHAAVTNVRIHELNNDNWIEYGRVNGLLIHLFGQTGDAVHDRVRYNANSAASTAVTIIGAGNRDPSILITEAPSITLMTTDLGAGTARQHFKMQIDIAGVWVATAWNPTSA